jgi:hypothetical protein
MRDQKTSQNFGKFYLVAGYGYGSIAALVVFKCLGPEYRSPRLGIK